VLPRFAQAGRSAGVHPQAGGGSGQAAHAGRGRPRPRRARACATVEGTADAGRPAADVAVRAPAWILAS